ncbi:voltage-gated potassium channel regulatory subunit KCNG2-like [Lampetra fluviatilis]
MPILTSGGEATIGDLHSYGADSAFRRPFAFQESPAAKGLHYRRARLLPHDSATLLRHSAPPPPLSHHHHHHPHHQHHTPLQHHHHHQHNQPHHHHHHHHQHLHHQQQHIHHQRQVVINVGGIRFAMPWTTLEALPSSRLGKLRSCSSRADILELCDDYDGSSNEFFFDRHPGAFRLIMSFVRAGKLRLLRDTCALAFRDELRYWGIDEASLEWCCRRRLLRRVEDDDAGTATTTTTQQPQQQPQQQQQQQPQQQQPPRPLRTPPPPASSDDGPAGPALSRRARVMVMLRDMVEDPSSGLPGKIFACLSVAFVAITAVSLCVSTMPDMRAEEEQGRCSRKCRDVFVVESVCVAWFSLEFALRFVQAPGKFRFLRDPLNLIDAFAILPYYVTLLVDAFSSEGGSPTAGGGPGSYLEKVGLALRVLRALRILYVMRLARHSLGLQTLGLTMRRCTRELGLLLLFLCVAMALFAPLVYLAETELSGFGGGGGTATRSRDFTSIPACYWWAIISMTTVGYGDMVPRSVAGQVVALSSILSGILLMAFPVTSIFHTFSRSYVELRESQLRSLHQRPPDSALLRDSWAASPASESSVEDADDFAPRHDAVAASPAVTAVAR